MARYEQGRMNPVELLRLFRTGAYKADVEEGVVYGRKGEPITPYVDKAGYHWVVLYASPKRKGIALHRLIWMLGVGKAIPRGFEVHHRNSDPANNRFDNLICVHEKDHRKLHAEDEIPF